MTKGIQGSQSSHIVNSFLSQNVEGYVKREDTEQNIFDIAKQNEVLVNPDTINNKTYETDLRFDAKYWEEFGAKKVDSYKEWSASDLSKLICDKYEYEDGSYSIVYTKPYNILDKLMFHDEIGQIIRIEDYNQTGDKLTESSINDHYDWSVTTFDDDGNKDISLSYVGFKNGDYINTKDYNANGTVQEEENHFEQKNRDNYVLHKFYKKSENSIEKYNHGSNREISEQEYQEINNNEHKA